LPRRPRRVTQRPATPPPDPRQRPAGLRLLPARAASTHDSAHPERQQGRRDPLLRRPRAARPLRSSRTHLADKDGFDMKWKPPFRGHSGTLAQATSLPPKRSPRGLASAATDGRRQFTDYAAGGGISALSVLLEL